MHKNKRACAALFEVLSLAFACPNKELLEVLESGAIAEAINEEAITAGVSPQTTQQMLDTLNLYTGSSGTKARTTLRIEYTRLFIGPPLPLISASEGVYRSKKEGILKPDMMINRYSLAIDGFMKSCGVFPADDNRDAIDCVHTECEFAAYLLASDKFSKEIAITPESAYLSFLEEHLQVWIPEFCDDVERNTRLPFYAKMAKMLKELVG